MVFMSLALGACQPEARTPSAAQGSEGAPPALGRSERLLLAAAEIGLPPWGVQPGDLPDPTSRGAQLEATYCAQCHPLPAPDAHSATDWPVVVRRMWLRMEWLPDSLGVKVPSAPERYELLQYLTVNSLKVSGSVLPAGRGRDAFALVCSRCHALPDPRVHSPEDWPIVYSRMEQIMERMKVAPPTAEQAEGVLSYLKTVGGVKRPAKASGD